jgi:hypothetical protein
MQTQGNGGREGGQTRPTPRPLVDDDTGGAERLGQQVRHSQFGEGVVLSFEGQGSHARVQVNFAHEGAKWLVAAYANLEVAD